jgi:hypothetical protein
MCRVLRPGAVRAHSTRIRAFISERLGADYTLDDLDNLCDKVGPVLTSMAYISYLEAPAAAHEPEPPQPNDDAPQLNVDHGVGIEGSTLNFPVDEVLEPQEALDRIEYVIVKIFEVVLVGADQAVLLAFDVNQLEAVLGNLKLKIASGSQAVLTNDDNRWAYRVPCSAPGKVVALASAQSGHNFSQLCVMLEIIHRHLYAGGTLLLRGLYYRLRRNLFRDTGDVARCLHNCVALLGCSRRGMGVVASSKGRVWGDIRVGIGDGVMTSYTGTATDPLAISGDINNVNRYKIEVDALNVLLVESEAAAHELVVANACDKLKCIIYSASGYSDLASRCFLRRLQVSNPNLTWYLLSVRGHRLPASVNTT